MWMKTDKGGGGVKKRPKMGGRPLYKSPIRIDTFSPFRTTRKRSVLRAVCGFLLLTRATDTPSGRKGASWPMSAKTTEEAETEAGRMANRHQAKNVSHFIVFKFLLVSV